MQDGSGRQTITAADAVILTPVMRAMLGESLLSDRPCLNVEQAVVHLERPIAPARLRAAWDTLARRHEGLRLALGDGAMPALIEPGVELSEAPLADTPDGLDDWLEADRQTPLDMDGPGWRVALLYGADRMVMVWTIHHALIDGQGLAVVLEELFDLLDERPLPDPPPQLSQLLPLRMVADRAAAEAFFSDYLARLADPPRIGSEGASGRRANCRVTLTETLTAAIGARARMVGGTPLTLLQAAWALVLARWSGEGDVVFGLVGAGRDPVSLRSVGCLIETLPMRVTLGRATDCATLLRQLRADTLALRQHSHADPADIRRWAGLGATPLFEAVLMYARGRLGDQLARQGKGWDRRRVQLLEESGAPLTLAAYEGPSLDLELDYDPARLDATQALRLMDHLRALLEALTLAPDDTPVGALDMLGADERARLLALSAPSDPVSGLPPCPARCFEAVASRQPEAIALMDGPQVLDYATLDRRANALAHRLHGAGLEPGDVVALCLPRSADHVIALLATLKAGVAFLPLDPGLPMAVRSQFLADAGAKALIQPLGQPPCGALPVLHPDPAAESTTPPPRPDPADRLAYVIFTSGSTGRPKGVMGSTRALNAHAQAVIAAYELAPGDRVLQFSGLGFDVALEEIVPTLLAGATLVLRDDSATQAIPAFLAAVAEGGITVLNLPASYWHVLAEALEPGALPSSVRLVVTGSERIDPQALARWQTLAPGVAWINAYGPTECTITCTAHRADAPADPGAEVPIGRPLGHARAHVLAPDGSLAPEGCEGFLAIGGPAVTLGYIGAPEATAAAFLDRLPGVADPRLYDTGDRARWRPDGQLAFLGRRDRQVKLRGYRIDLHQVEAALGQIPDLSRAHVALAWPRTPRARLVAWAVSSAPAETIAQALAALLPAPMLPQVVVVDDLPVTANAKIDTAALIAALPEPAALPDPGADAAPVDPLSQAIADCMAEVLGLPRVDVDARFHDVGGDSLQALRLARRIEAATGHTVQATDLHHYPSARALADRLRAGGNARYSVPIQPGKPGRCVLFAVHVLGRREELFRPLAAALGPDQPLIGLSVGLPKSLDEIDVERTAAVYFDEVQTNYPDGPVALVAVSMATYFAYELAQRLLAAGREVRVLAILDALGPDAALPGARPYVRGIAKLGTHLSLLRRHGLDHLHRTLSDRRARREETERLLAAGTGEVTMETLVNANVEAVARYRPAPCPKRLTVFRAAENEWYAPAFIRAGMGWSSVAAAGFEVIDLPGDHLSILHDGNVRVLARHLAERMSGQG